MVCELMFLRLPRAGWYIRVWVHTYLEGSHAELDTESQINVEVVGQKIEEHVVGAKQRDEEEGGLSQAPVGQKEGACLPAVIHRDVLISERNLGYGALSPFRVEKQVKQLQKLPV